MKCLCSSVELKCFTSIKVNATYMCVSIHLQPEVMLFGPHDTSRVSESDLPPFTPQGQRHICGNVHPFYGSEYLISG